MVKRSAEEQISTYTDFEKLEETQNSAGTWQKANEEELSKRKIVKIKRPTNNNLVNKIEMDTSLKSGEARGGGESCMNPFASVELVAKKEGRPDAIVKKLEAPILPEISTEMANNSFTKSPEKSATSLSSGGLSISIPSPSMAVGQHSNKSFGGSSPTLNSAKSSTLTPGSRTPGGGKKVNPFSGQSPKGNPNPFLSVQDDGNKNNDMWLKLSGSKGSPPQTKDSKTTINIKGSESKETDKTGIAERTVHKADKEVIEGVHGASALTVAKPFILSTSTSGNADTGKNAVFAKGFSGFSTVTSGSTQGGWLSDKKSHENKFGSIPPSHPDSNTNSAGGRIGINGSSIGESSWLFKKSSGNSFLDSIKDNKIEVLFGSKSTSDDSTAVKSTESEESSTGISVERQSKGVSEEEGAEEAQSEEHTMHTAYGKVYAMVGGPLLTGEENEKCLLQVRAKLFKLVMTQPLPRDHDEDSDDTGHEDEKAKALDKDNDNDKGRLEWAEVGVGPLRALKAKDGPGARLVMRREDKKGGQGTKVILNIKIREYTSARQQGEKALCVSTFVPVSACSEEGRAATGDETKHATEGDAKPVSYMLRCKLASEISQLHSIIEDEILQAKKTS